MNPSFFAAKQLRQYLKELKREYGAIELECDLTDEERALLQQYSYPDVRAELLFDSSIRTGTMVAVHLLEGHPSATIQAAVPGAAPDQVKTLITRLVEKGILTKLDGGVRFNPDLPALEALRRLLDAYARRLPQYAEHAQLRKIEERKRNNRRGGASPVFLTPQMDASIAFLAVNGPSRIQHVRAFAGSRGEGDLESLTRSGVLASDTVAARHRVVSLNAAHPLYNEIVEWGEARLGQKRRHGQADLRVALVEYELHRFLGTEPRTIALTLSAGIAGGVDATTLATVYSHHDYGAFGFALRAWEHAGLLIRQRVCARLRFKLNPGYGTYSALLRLLTGVLREWPEYQKACRKAERIYAARAGGSKK